MGHDHYFTMANRKHVTGPDLSSHHFKLSSPSAKCFFDGNIYEIFDNEHFFDIQKKIGVENNLVNKSGCIIHFIKRDLLDNISKSYYQWKTNSGELRECFIRSCILEGMPISNRLDMLSYNEACKKVDENMGIFDLDNEILNELININIFNDEYKYDTKYYEDILKKSNLSEDDVQNFVKKYDLINFH